MPQPQNTSMQDPQLNMLLREALLKTALPQSVDVGTFTGANTAPMNIRLQNVGITTKLRLRITAAVTIATDALTASKKAPWSLIDTLKVVDFNGQERINISGFHLWLINCMRARTIAYYNNEAKTAVSALPFTPTAIATDNIELYLEVPIAYDAERDLRGAMLTQVANSEWYLKIIWANPYLIDGDVDSVYSADGASGTATAGTITVKVFQDFLEPQPVQDFPFIPLPLADLSTVYELQGKLRQTDNIVNGGEKLMPIPNYRSVIGILSTYVNNKALSNAISSARIVANGNKTLISDTLETRRMAMRQWLNGDTADGVYFWQFRQNPIQTVLYGNMAFGMTFNAAVTNPYLENTFESFVPKGATLPGLTN